VVILFYLLQTHTRNAQNDTCSEVLDCLASSLLLPLFLTRTSSLLVSSYRHPYTTQYHPPWPTVS
jgi:hypothetical protein